MAGTSYEGLNNMPFDAKAVLDDLYNTDASGWTTGKVRQLIVDESRKQGVDPALMLSLAHQESRFDPTAKSPTGVVGLFQVTRPTGQDYGQPPDDVSRADPTLSAPAGIAYFKDLLAQTKGNVPQALQRYNGGSDPNFAGNVLGRYRMQAASLGGMGQGGQAGAGEQVAQAFDPKPVLEELYGPVRTPAPAPVPVPATQAPPQAPATPAGKYEETPVIGIQGKLPPGAVTAPAQSVTAPSALPSVAEAPRRIDPRTMDDAALLRAIGADPNLVMQSRFYTPDRLRTSLMQPGGFMDWLMQTPAGSLAAGLRMPLDAGVQMATRALRSQGVLKDADVALIDAQIALQRAEYEQQTRTEFDVPIVGKVRPGELAGQMLFPLPGAKFIPGMSKTAGVVSNIARGIGRGAVTGAEAGLAQPVYQPGAPGTPSDTYAQQKWEQAKGGALVGGGMGVLLSPAEVALNKAANARRMATMAETAGSEAERLKREMIATPYESMADINAAAARGEPRALNLQQAISDAGEDWNKIAQTSGGVNLFKQQLLSDAKYEVVKRLATPLGNAPIPNTLHTIDEQLALLRNKPLPDEGSIALLERLRKSLSPRTETVTVPPPVGSPLHTLPSTSTRTVPADTSYLRLDDARKELANEITNYYAPKGEALLGTVRRGHEGLGAFTEVQKNLMAEMDDFASRSGVPDLVKAAQDAKDFYARNVVPYHDKALANAFKNDFSDEVYRKFIQTGKGERAQYFYDALEPKGQAAIRYGMLEEAMHNAIDPVSGKLDSAKFTQYLHDKQAATGVFFTGSAAKELDGVASIIRHDALLRQWGQKIPALGSLAAPALGAISLGAPGAIAGGALTSVLEAAKALMSFEGGRRFLASASGLEPGSGRFQRALDAALRNAPRAVAAQEQRSESS